MPRIFISSIPEVAERFVITGQEARYILSVLRLRVGEELSLIDRNGYLYLARIETVVAKTVEVGIMETIRPAPQPADGVVLLQGILKGRKMDLVVQKTTELGVKEIVPLATERTQVRDTRKLERWRKLALEAARQCGRTVVPEVRPPVEMGDYLGRCSGPLRGFILWEGGGRPLERDMMPPPGLDLHAAVGPEGGFTPEEVRMAEERGLLRATLGPLVLRAETAAISTVTLLQFLMGRMA